MTAFEFIFSLFALVLGLSLAEVLNGLVRTVKGRRRMRVGVLTPLLGTFVMFHIASFWIDMWQLRDHLTVNSGILYAGVILAGIYYFSASLVFPDQVEEWPDLDTYYFEHKNQVLVGVLSCKLIVTIGKRLATEPEGTSATGIMGLGLALVVGSGLIYLATRPQTRRWNIFVLLLLILPLVVTATIGLFTGATPQV